MAKHFFELIISRNSINRRSFKNRVEVTLLQGTFTFGKKICVYVSLSLQGSESCCFSGPKTCPTLCHSVDCSTPDFPVLHYFPELLKLIFTESVMPSNPLILCCPFFLLPTIFPSIRVFSNELALHIRWPKYCSFSISPSSEYSGLISFRIDKFDLLAVQETLKRLLQHHSLKATVLWCSAFFTVQLSHPFMTTGKTISLTIRTFIS